MLKMSGNCVVCLKLPGFSQQRLDEVLENEKKINFFIGLEQLRDVNLQSAGKSDTFHKYKS